MKTNLVAASILAALGSLSTDAAADVVIQLEETTWAAGKFSMFFEPGRLMGTLTGVTACNFYSATGPQVPTFTVYLVQEQLLSPQAYLGQPFTPPAGGRLQVGGSGGPQPPLGLASEIGFWDAPLVDGFELNDAYTPINGGFDVSQMALLLGNGMTPPPSGGIERTYWGMVILHGVCDPLPSPGAAALLAISGLLGSRRRR